MSRKTNFFLRTYAREQRPPRATPRPLHTALTRHARDGIVTPATIRAGPVSDTPWPTAHSREVLVLDRVVLEKVFGEVVDGVLRLELADLDEALG